MKYDRDEREQASFMGSQTREVNEVGEVMREMDGESGGDCAGKKFSSFFRLSSRVSLSWNWTRSLRGFSKPPALQVELKLLPSNPPPWGVRRASWAFSQIVLLPKALNLQCKDYRMSERDTNTIQLTAALPTPMLASLSHLTTVLW